MKADEFLAAKRPSKDALPGEGAWMTGGANPPEVSQEFFREARRLTNKRKKPSKEQIAGLADRYEAEAQDFHDKESKRRSSGLARRGTYEEGGGSRRPSKEVPAGLQRPDLHPDLLGVFQPPELLQGPLEMGRKSSKDSRVSLTPSEGAASRSEAGRAPAAARERRSIQEILSKYPQLRANVDRLKTNPLSKKPPMNPANPEDKAALNDLFLCYDPKGDGTGSLSYREFSHLVKDLGLKLSKYEVEGMIKLLDDNGNGLIEIDEFGSFFIRAGARDEMKANAEDMGGSKNAFVRQLFDEYGDPSGRGLDLEGLKLVVKACQLDQGEHKVTPKQVKQFFQRLDVENSGFLSSEKVQFFFDNVQGRAKLKDAVQNVGIGDEDLLKQVFEKFDSSQKGEMNEFDLHAAVQFLGYNLTQSCCETLLSKIDADNNGTVEVDEFIDFFEQMRNTEELMEELENFKKAQQKQKYIHGLGTLIGGTLVAGGIYVTFGPESESDSAMLSYGYGSMFIGGVILSMLFLPSLFSLLYRFFFHECVRTFNPTKAILINLALTMTIFGIWLNETLTGGDVYAEPVNSVLRVLSALLLLVCALEAAWGFFAYAGFLEPVSEIEDLSAEDPDVSRNFLVDLARMEQGTSKKISDTDSDSTRTPTRSDSTPFSKSTSSPQRGSPSPAAPKRAFQVRDF